MTAPRRPPTGTQARAERTRTAVIDETVRCILDEGFAPPSVRHITERAGLTWGVVQYHFGDLDGLLMAVVDRGFGELLDALAELPTQAVREGSVAARTAFVVDTIWDAFSSPTSMAALEILISTRGLRDAVANTHLADLMTTLTSLGRHLGEGLSAPHAGRPPAPRLAPNAPALPSSTRRSAAFSMRDSRRRVSGTSPTAPG